MSLIIVFQGPPVIVICKFCNEDCDEEEYDAHKVQLIQYESVFFLFKIFLEKMSS